MQLIIVILVLTLALIYVAYSLYRAFTQNKGDRCYGCPLKDACKNKDKEKKINSCPPDRK